MKSKNLKITFILQITYNRIIGYNNNNNRIQNFNYWKQIKDLKIALQNVIT